VAKLLLLAFAFLLVWGYRNVRLAPRRKRPAPPPVRQAPPRPPSPAHEVLGVAADATPDAIRRAYLEQVRRHHPDRLVDATPAARAAAERRTAELNAAYNLLCPK
jgi:DnaJ-domain-containing protein 1